MKKFAPKAGPRGARPARSVRDAPPRKSFARDSEAPPRKSFARDSGAPPRKSFARDSDAPRRSYRDEAGARPARGQGYGDPYQRTMRPRPPRDDGERPAGRSGGFTVTLDPDVARVFRGDASVNKALRLVLQLMQVVQGPPPRGARPAGRGSGYQGSDEARGFSRKPRFIEDEQEDIEGEE